MVNCLSESIYLVLRMILLIVMSLFSAWMVLVYHRERWGNNKFWQATLSHSWLIKAIYSTHAVRSSVHHRSPQSVNHSPISLTASARRIINLLYIHIFSTYINVFPWRFGTHKSVQPINYLRTSICYPLPIMTVIRHTEDSASAKGTVWEQLRPHSKGFLLKCFNSDTELQQVYFKFSYSSPPVKHQESDKKKIKSRKKGAIDCPLLRLARSLSIPSGGVWWFNIPNPSCLIGKTMFFTALTAWNTVMFFTVMEHIIPWGCVDGY